MNNSWGYRLCGSGCYSETIRGAVNYAARRDVVFVASKGNGNTGLIHYPSDYDGSWVISVGGTTQSGARGTPNEWGYDQQGRPYGSNYGNGIDVVAPGTDIYSAGGPFGQPYGNKSGTSMAAPHVSGIAALLLSEARDIGITLHPSDVEGIIRMSAEQTDPDDTPGHDDFYGAGRVNAARALERLQAPWLLHQAHLNGGTVVDVGGTQVMTILNSTTDGAGQYLAKRHTVQNTATFDRTYTTNPEAWCRGANESIGWSYANPNYLTNWCRVVSRTATSATFETNVYQLWTTYGSYLGWYPTEPQGVRFAYSTLGLTASLSTGITGPDFVQVGDGETWQCNPSGGGGGYTYRWDYRAQGSSSWSYTGSTGSSYTRTAGQDDFELRCRVTAGFQTASATFPVSTYEPDDDPGDGGVPCKPGQICKAAGSSVTAYALHGASPNPSSGAATVRYDLPEAADVRVAVYDALGREIARLASGQQEAGAHAVHLAGSGLPAGVYLIRMEARGTEGAHVETARFTVVP